MYNNRNIRVWGSTRDKIRDIKNARKAAEDFEENRYSSKKDSVMKSIGLLYNQKELVKESNYMIINKNNYAWGKTNASGDVNAITEKLRDLSDLGKDHINFFDYIGNKKNTSKEFLDITIKNLSDVTHTKQAGSANESIGSWKKSYEYYNKVKSNNGKLVAWDLETIGGKDPNGIWTPEGITEFSMQEYNFKTKEINKKTVLIGFDEDLGEDIYKEIEKAIKNETIDTNERLKVTAMRLAKYGDEDFSYKMLENKGYFVATNFPKTEKNNYKDLEAIRKGVDRLIDIGKKTGKDKDGVRLDIKAIASHLSDIQEQLFNNKAVLAGFNDSLFDQPILSSMLLKWEEQYPTLKNLFKDNRVAFNVPSEKSIDLFGGIKLFSDYNPLSKLYGGENISDISKIRGQEFLAGKHLANWFEKMGLRPHMAEDDVTALIGLITMNSEILKDQSLFEYINQGINKIDTVTNKLEPGKQVLKAKKYIGQDIYGGKNFFNFAQSKSKGTIFTADNHMIGVGDKALEAAGGALKEEFNTGFGINKGAFYDISAIREIELTDSLRKKIGGIAREYSGTKIYQVQLNMVVDDIYKDTRLGDLTQNLMFKSEKEMIAFLSSNFDVMGERDKDGSIKINKDQRKSFDMREMKKGKNGKVKLEKINPDNLTDAELFQAKVIENNERLLTSRADGNMFRDNSYKKIKKAINVQEKLSETLGYNVTGTDITMLMSEKVAKGQMPLDLSNKQISSAREIIYNALSYDKNNVERLLDSSVDNLATGMNMIASYQTMLSNVINVLESDDRFKNASDDVKQKMFARTLKAVKQEAADFVYSKNSTSDMMVLGNKKLVASFEDFKNMYEIDYTKLMKGKKISFVDSANPEELANILKLDLSNSSTPFSLINNITEIVHGKKFKGEDPFQKDAMEKLFSQIVEDKDLNQTNAIKQLKREFEYTGKKFNKDFHQYQIAEGIISGMKEVKSKNATKGIINVEHAFMKSIEAHTGFSSVLNSQPVLDLIPQIANEVLDSKIIESTGTIKNSKKIARDLVQEFYMPKLETVKGGKGWNKAQSILYDNVNNDLTDYLTNVIYSISNIEGTNIAVQKDGALLAIRGNRMEEIILPKVKYNQAKGVMYTEIGSMKMQLNNELIFKNGYDNVRGTTRSTLGKLNDFNVSNNVRKIAEMKGSDEAFDRFLGIIGLNNNKIRQGSTINGFGGNDLDSNNFVAVKNIKDVLVDLFAENGKLNNVVNNTDYADKEFLSNMKEYLKYYKNGDKKLEKIDAEMNRDLVKNMKFVLEAISSGGNVDNNFKTLIKDLGFTGQEKKVSDTYGVYGSRPGNSTLFLHDNIQRPTVTQSGNALELRVDDIKKSKFNIKAGNTITSKMMNKRTFGESELIGKTATDVMMDITYVDSSALQTLLDSNFKKVIEASNVDAHTQEMKKRAYKYVKESISTFEQERILDSRVHEAAFGLKTASTQKFSKTFDIVNIMNNLDEKNFDKQLKALVNFRGSFELNEAGDLIYKSSKGKLLKRGEEAFKWEGFAGLNNSFVSKMHNGVFNFNYYNENGVKLNEKEINKIIKENKSLFFDKNNKPLTQLEMANKLEKALEKKGIKGQFAIEDISALGYAKTMTSGVEKGMTDIVYAATGSYDKNVKAFFQETGYWNMVKNKVITDEALEAMFYSNENKSKNALNKAGFKSIDALKKAINKERHFHSSLLFDEVLNGKAHLLANDAVAKHGNIGQIYQGLLSKAVEGLSKKTGSTDKATKMIADLINNNEEYQFIGQFDLNKNTTKGAYSNIKIKSNKGYLFIDDEYYNMNKTSSLNFDKFSSLIKRLDKELEGLDDSDRLISKNVYTLNSDGKYEHQEELLGSHMTINKDIVVNGDLIKNAKVVIGTNTRENTKYLRDSETQTGVDYMYFEKKKMTKQLKLEKIKLKEKLVTADKKEASEIHLRLMEIDNQLDKIDVEAYAGGIKTMRFGDQELSILERVSMTDAHVEKIQELIEKGEIDTKSILEAEAFRGKVQLDKNGKLVFDESVVNKRSLRGLTNQLKNNQFYDSYSDMILTEDMLKDEKYAHLKGIHEYAKKHNLMLGVKGAEQEYQIQMAMKATEFNDGDHSLKYMLDNGFKVKSIDDINFGVDNLVEENIIVDLGEKFRDKRYVAVPGTGMKIADEEIKTQGQKKLNLLKNRYEDLEYLHGEKTINADLYNETFDKVLNAREETIKAVDNSVFGKNGLHHKASQIEIDAVSYRLKASGVISNTTTKELAQAAKEAGINLIEGEDLTKKAMIAGKTIAEWEKNGEAFFDYKFLSREQFEKMGYFDKKTLKKFNFTEDEMTDFLKTHGTFDITDRYPNTRSGSINQTRVFLDDTLQGNQTKISVTTMLKANADHDGDSYSSFRVEYKDKGNVVDGAMYELAKVRGKEEGISAREYAVKNNLMSGKVYDMFAEQEMAMMSTAMTDNKQWQQEAANKIRKDFIKNTSMYNAENMVLVPGGESVLGKYALTTASSLPDSNEFQRIEKESNHILESAKNILEQKGQNASKFNITIDKAGDSGKLLDEALTVVKGSVDSDTYQKMEATAIKRVSLDKHVQEILAKTGLATTGSVNLSLNAVKLAQVFSEKSAKDIAFSNYVWAALDVAEQGVISSKKLEGIAYNDTRLKDFKKIMNDIYDYKQPVAPKQAVEGLVSWLDDYGSGIFEESYKTMGDRILSKKQLSSLSNLSGEEKTAKAVEYMKGAFVDGMLNLSSDKLAVSYRASVEATGRNGSTSKRIWKSGLLGAAAEEGNSLASRHQGMMGKGDPVKLKLARMSREYAEQASEASESAKEKLLDNNSDVAKGIERLANTVVNNMEDNSHLRPRGGMGKAVLGLAAGLMIGGYASGNPLKDKSADEVNKEHQQQQQTMSIPEFLDKDSGYVTGNTQQGYIINIKADTKKGRKYMEKIMSKAAEATVGGAVSINMNIKNKSNNGTITDSDIENYINKNF